MERHSTGLPDRGSLKDSQAHSPREVQLGSKQLHGFGSSNIPAQARVRISQVCTAFLKCVLLLLMVVVMLVLVLLVFEGMMMDRKADRWGGACVVYVAAFCSLRK